MDCIPPGDSVHGNFQQEYWSGLPFLTSEDLPDPGSEPMSRVSCIDRQILYHSATQEAL